MSTLTARLRDLGADFTRTLAGRTCQPARHKQRTVRARLSLEGLEDRSVPSAILPGFNTTTFLPNDDGTYPTNSLTDFTPPGTPVAQSLGFTANFFGVSSSTAYINNNGNITFDQPLSDFTPFGLTSTATQIIAPFFADVDTRFAGSLVTFGQGTVDGHAAFGVNWVNVDYFSSDPSHTNRDSFQLVLIDRSDTGTGNFDIEFNYDQIQWETGQASGGDANGLGGSSAHTGFSNGTGIPGTFFELNGSGTPGSFLDSNSVTGLIHNSLNSPVLGRRHLRARNGTIVIHPSFVVTNTNDSGIGSLRQAILSSNASPGLDTISFAIPARGAHDQPSLTSADDH